MSNISTQDKSASNSQLLENVDRPSLQKGRLDGLRQEWLVTEPKPDRRRNRHRAHRPLH